MTLYNSGDIKLVFTKVTERISISKGRDFVCIPQSTFQIWMQLIKMKSDYDIVTSEIGKYKVKIVNVCGNFVLILLSDTNSSSILIKEDECGKILDKLDIINKKIDIALFNKNKKNMVNIPENSESNNCNIGSLTISPNHNKTCSEPPTKKKR